VGNKGIRPAVRQMAYGGIGAALILVLMLFSSLLPFMEYAIPAACGLIIGYLEKDCGRKTSFCCYLASAILAVLFLPNKEPAMLYACFFGYYPIWRSFLMQRFWQKRWIQWIGKYTVFNGAMVLSYFLLIKLFGLTQLWEDLNMGMQYGAILLLAAGNIAFWLYDLLLLRAEQMYQAKKMGLKLQPTGYLGRFFSKIGRK
jgi:hypothetical protein